MTTANVTYTSSPFVDAKSVYIQVVSACINLVLKTSYASERERERDLLKKMNY